MGELQTLQERSAANVHERIKRHTKETNTSVESIIAILGCSKTAFYRRLSGEVPFTMSDGYKLAKILGCNVSDFFE